jgi:hypothetical protein
MLESGNYQEGGLALQHRLRVLRDAYRRGFYMAPTTVPLPEIVADGHGPDDWIGDSTVDAPTTDQSRWRDWPFRVAPDLQGRPFCPKCGALLCPLDGLCPVCGDS